MLIHKSILHIFDFHSNVCVLSQREMDIAEHGVGTYLEKHIEKSMSDAGKKEGRFLENSSFLASMERYQRGELSFAEFSSDVAGKLYEQLALSEQPDSMDFIMVDFREEESSYIGLLLMSNRLAYTHQVVTEDETVRNEIIHHYGILPSMTQKAESFAIIHSGDYSIGFSDKKRSIEGETVFLLPEVILQCDSMISPRDAVKLVGRIATKVAEENGENAPVAVSKAKNFIVENSEVSPTFCPFDLGKEVFPNSTRLQNEFEHEVKEAKIPARIKMEREFAVRTGRNHKIKTDTGIEITIPADYFANADYVEFVNNPDGTISIQLKNIGKIINR